MDSNFRTIFLLGIGASSALALLHAYAVQYPQLSWSATLLAAILGLGGLVVFGAAALMALTSATSPADDQRRANLLRCLRLAGFGLLAMIPLVSFVLQIVLFP